MYEQTVLKILNIFSSEKLTYPDGHESYGAKFAKP
jgi:hypothetical protein